MKRLACLSLIGLIAACQGNVSLGQAPQASTPGTGNGQQSDGSSATGPWGITCSTYWRAGGTGDELSKQTFTARSDATTSQTITYPSATIEISLAPAPDAATEALLTVNVPSQKSTQTYRISRDRRPAAQFIGDHGFTGLVYAGAPASGGVDLQYICEADASTPPTRGASVTPLDVLCQVELRTTPGGAVEKRSTIVYKPDVNGSPQQGETASADFGADGAVTLQGFDDSFEGRSVIVGIATDGQAQPGASARGVRQLYQLDRNTALLNQLAGTTFSGRVTLITDTNKELSYACSARTDSTGGSACPAVSDGPCNAGCTASEGQLYAPERDCKLPNSRVVTCQGPTSQTLDLTCTQRSDGAVVLGSGSLRQVPGFTPCDADTSKRALAAPTCPF